MAIELAKDAKPSQEEKKDKNESGGSRWSFKSAVKHPPGSPIKNSEQRPPIQFQTPAR